MDLVFKALADSSRRQLLDQLHAATGQTLKQLCTDLTMTRQAVTKHLTLLETAGLVTITWRGREKLHFLNPVPLQRISARWIEKYERPQAVPRPALPHRLAPPAAPIPTETEGENRWANLHAL